MRILLTGATGFVGSHVARLLDGRHEVRALSRNGLAPLELPVEWVAGDMTDAASLRAAVDGCDAVIHCAAVLGNARAQASYQRRVNVDGTRALLDAARDAGVRRFVHTSSIAAIGRPGDELADESKRYDWPPGMLYQESKRDSEALALHASDGKFEVVSLNPAVVVGPDEPKRKQVTMIKLVEAGLGRLAPPGATTLCDVRDVAAAHVAALERGRPGERYVLGGPTPTYREWFAALADALGAPAPVATVPDELVHLAEVPLAALDRWLVLPRPPIMLEHFRSNKRFSSEKAEKELGYATRPLDDMMRDLVAWYRAL